MLPSSAGTPGATLFNQHRAREKFRTMNKPDGFTLSDAYDVQDALLALRLADTRSSIAAYKIGLTTKRMQQFVSIDHPIAGSVLACSIISSPAHVRAADYVRLGLECEIAVRVNRPIDIRHNPPTRQHIADAIDQCAAAFEIIEDRDADYSAIDVLSLVADNSWNAGIVLGTPVRCPEIGDLEGVLQVNGADNDGGSSKDVLGHPLDAVAWLATHLSARGKRLEAGQWVMTGSIVPTRFPKPGDRYLFTVEGMSSVEANII